MVTEVWTISLSRARKADFMAVSIADEVGEVGEAR